MRESKQKNTEFNDEIKELVIARIDAQVPSNLRLSIGLQGHLTKDEMIKHVQDGDDIGKRIIESHMRFLRAQFSGKLTKALTSVE